MLLAVDVGNTQTVFGLFVDGELRDQWRVATEPQRTGDELGALYSRFFDPSALSGIVLTSSVPPLIREYEAWAERYVHTTPLLVVGPGTRTGIALRYDDPRELGADRIANAVAASELYGPTCIVVDFGTSTNFDAVRDGEFVGGVLAPGIEISMDALFERAARLVKVDFVEPATVIGRTTASAMQSGLVYGFAGQVDGIVGRMREELGGEAPAIATGGLAELIAPHSRTIERVDPMLTLVGLRLIWERNRE